MKRASLPGCARQRERSPHHARSSRRRVGSECRAPAPDQADRVPPSPVHRCGRNRRRWAWITGIPDRWPLSAAHLHRLDNHRHPPANWLILPARLAAHFGRVCKPYTQAMAATHIPPPRNDDNRAHRERAAPAPAPPCVPACGKWSLCPTKRNYCALVHGSAGHPAPSSRLRRARAAPPAWVQSAGSRAFAGHPPTVCSALRLAVAFDHLVGLVVALHVAQSPSPFFQ